MNMQPKNSALRWIAGILVTAFCCAMFLASAACLSAASSPVDTVITNVASVKYSDANGSPKPMVTGRCETTISGRPILRAVKLPSSNPVAIGGRLTYTIEYENSGNAAAENIVLVDTLSSLVTPVSYQSAVYTPAGNGQSGMLTWKIASLDAGEKGTFQFSVDVSSLAKDKDEIVNKLDFSSTQTGSQSIQITQVGQAPNLLVNLNASRDYAAPGEEIEYTVSYQNIGNLPSTNSVLSVQLPKLTALIEGSISGNGGLSGRIVSWNLGSLAPGDSGKVTFRIRVSPVAGEGVSIQAMAVISCNELGAISSSDVLTMVRKIARLTVSKEAGKPAVKIGELLSYNLEVRNTGNVDLTRVVLRDRIPEGTSPVQNGDSGQVFDGYCVWQFDKLAVNESQRVTINFLVGSYAAVLGSVDNQAEAYNIVVDPVSASTRTPVTASNRSIIEFITADGLTTTMYGPDDPIGVRVTDLSENTDPRTVETIVVVVTNANSGDSETVILTETGVNTGVFVGKVTQTRSQPVKSDDGFLTTDEDNALTASYADPEFPGETSVIDTAWVDPVGVVFDSITSLPVTGAKVTLIDNSTGKPATLPPLSLRGQTVERSSSAITGADGRFTFGAIPPGSYHIQVICASYVYPSTESAANLGAVYSILNGSRGENFTISVESSPVTFDIPLDREAKDLLIEKTSTKTRVTAGEMVPFKVVLTNRSPGLLTNLSISDTLPHGLQYVPGSTKIDGKTAADPVCKSPRVLSWQIPSLISQKKIEVAYVTVLGPGVRTGDISNQAMASALHLGRPVRSRNACATIQVREGLFTDRGTILGRVFLDTDGNKVQNASGEAGISGVRMILEDGTYVETDQNGLFSIQGVRPGTHLLRLDPETMPADFTALSTTDRDEYSPDSRVVELPHGGVFKADFPLFPGPGYIPNASVPIEASGSALPDVTAGENDWEKLIGSMTPVLAILAPADKQQNPGQLLRLVVKGAFDRVLRVSINDQAIHGLKPARTVTQRSNGVKIQEFLGLPLPAEATSTVKVAALDPDGKILEECSIGVYSTGAAHELRLLPPEAGMTADGRTVGEVRIEVLDRSGRRVAVPLTVMVEIDQGEIVSPDADPAMEGHQIVLDNGTGVFRVRAPFDAGSATISALGGDMRAKGTLRFVPNLSGMVITGLGEVVIGSGDATGDTSFMRRWEGFEDGQYSGGRGAFFINGRIGNNMQLTAAYDSAKEKELDLFRISESDPNLEYRYPIVGDSGKVFYSAVSQKKFYLKLERGMSRLLYGDFNTEFEATRTAAYTRILNGLQLKIDGRRTDLNAFYTSTDRTMVVDILRAQGISGFYSLTNRRVVPGSERVVIETRDRWRPEFVIDRLPRTRDLDYEVDYVMGTLRMKEPVSSSDASMNPIFIIVTYEHESESEKYPVVGGRAVFKPSLDIELGLTGIKEEQLAGDYNLNAGDLTLKLPGHSVLKAEWARTDSLFDENGSYRQRHDTARSIELKGNPGKRLGFETWYRQAGDYFKNPSALDVFSGSHRMGGKFTYDIRDGLTLRGMHYLEKDDRNDMFYRHSSLGFEKELTGSKLSVDYIEERAQDGYLPPTLQGNRQPFDIAEQTPDNLKAGRVSYERSLNDRMTLQLSHKANISGRSYRLSNAGLQYRLNSLTNLYARQEFARFDATKDTRLVAGAESEVVRNTVAFSEYRLGNGSSESRIQQSMGLRNTFMLGESSTGNLSVERLETTSGKELSQQPDATAVSLGFESLPLDDLKFTTRLERRLSGIGDTDSIDITAAWSVNSDLHLSLSERWYRLDQPDSDLVNASRLLFGIAYRPVFWDRFNALGKIERRKGMTSGMQIGGDNSKVLLYSFDGVYQMAPRLQVIGRVACKHNEELGFSERTDLVSGRIIHEIGRRFDVSAEYRVMRGETAESTIRGGTVEIGTSLYRDLWLGLGYSFEKFDADLIGDQYEGKGVYLRARFKFDEDLFGLNRKKKKKTPPPPADDNQPVLNH